MTSQNSTPNNLKVSPSVELLEVIQQAKNNSLNIILKGSIFEELNKKAAQATSRKSSNQVFDECKQEQPAKNQDWLAKLNDANETICFDTNDHYVTKIADLLGGNANDSATDQYGRTALHLAVIYQLKDIVQLLLGNFDVNKVDNDEHTPLNYAILKITDDFAILEMLCINKNIGVNINYIGKSGYSPLHQAIKLKKYAVAEFLIDNGADKDLKDKHGNTSLELLEKQLSKIENVDNIENISETGDTQMADIQKLCNLMKQKNTMSKNNMFPTDPVHVIEKYHAIDCQMTDEPKITGQVIGEISKILIE